MQKFFKSAISAAGLVGFTALFGCGSESSNPSVSDYTGEGETPSTEASVCGDYTAYADGLGNTYCLDASGAVIFAVLADGSVIYAESSSASAGVDTSTVVIDPSTGDTTVVIPSSSSAAEISICGESGAPISVLGNLYFYSDALGTYYYNVADASCTKIYTSAVSSSSSLAPASSAGGMSSSSGALAGVSSGEVSGASSSSYTVVEASSSSVVISNGSSPVVTFSGSVATVEQNNNCVSIDGSTVTVSCAGDYYFTGSSDDGQIIVAASSEDKVYLYLNGLTLTSGDAPIYAQKSDKTFIVAVSGTTNTLTDGSSRSKVYNYYNSSGELKTDTTKAAIYAKDDLTIKGSGTLKVNGNYGNGIHTTNDLKVRTDDEFGGAPTVIVTAKNNALKGKGSVDIDGGAFTLTTSEGDGIKSDEGEDEGAVTAGKGVVVITGGTFNITAADDGIQAYNYVLIADSTSTPTVTIKAGSGEPDVSSSDGGTGGMGGMGGGWNQRSSSSSSTDESSSKGIIGGDSITINAGNITVASYKDAVHSNGYAIINGGNLELRGRNGIHADKEIKINGGTVSIPYSYEGVEAEVIRFGNATTYIYSTDDAWNASDGNEDNCSTCYVYVTAGKHYAIGKGDGLDSNYGMEFTGGIVLVAQSGNGNGIFDIGNGSFTVSGTAVVLGVGTSDMTECPSASTSLKATGSYSQNTTIAILSGGSTLTGAIKLPFSASQIQWAYGSGSYTVMSGVTLNGTYEYDYFATSGSVSGGSNVSGSTCSSSGGGFGW